jgi:hypothetical protein
MSRFGWFVVGLGLGAFAAIQAKDNPKVKAAADELIGYKEREAELSKPKARPSSKKQ